MDSLATKKRFLAFVLLILYVATCFFTSSKVPVQGQTIPKQIFLKTYFVNSTNVQLYISLQSLNASFQITSVLIRDTLSNNIILNLSGQNSFYLATPNLQVEKERSSREPLYIR